MTTTADVLGDAGYDFDDLDEPESAGSGHLGRPAEPGTSRTSTPGGTRPRRRASKTRLDSLQKKLSGEMFSVGAMAGFAVPVTGMYVCNESDAFTKALVQLASSRPEWVAALENIAAIQPGIVIGRTAFGIGASLAVDRGRADPEKRVMMALGVYQAWKQIQDQKKPGEGDNASSSNFRPPPASFRPVGIPANAQV